VDLGGDDGADRVKLAVLQTLLEIFPDAGAEDQREKPSVGAVEDVYVYKMVRVSNEMDRWSLFSLSNSSGL